MGAEDELLTTHLTFAKSCGKIYIVGCGSRHTGDHAAFSSGAPKGEKSMKETYFAIIGAVPTLLIGVENYIYFFVSGKLGFLTALISKPIKSFLDPPDYICAGIVGALAIFIEFCLSAQYDGDDSYIRVTNTGTEVNLMRIVSNLVYIVCALPLILLVGYGFRWVVYRQYRTIHGLRLKHASA